MIGGDGSGATGTVTVSGKDTIWTNTAGLYVGFGHSGTLTIESGGQVSNTYAYIGFDTFPGSTAMVTVTGEVTRSGPNSGNLTIGYYSAGTLTIADGGTVEVDGTLLLAQFSGSTGTLAIGAAATDPAAAAGILDADTLTFGAGTGTLVFNHTDTDYQFNTAISGNGTISHLAGDTIFSGDSSGFTGDTDVDGGTLEITGQLAGGSGTIGSSTGSDGAVIVSGTGASWKSTSYLYAGHTGDGALTVENGGLVSDSSAAVGFNFGSTGSVTVSGDNSVWTNSSTVFIGYYGTGMLTIADGGEVNDMSGTVGTASDSVGTVTVTGAGSLWNTSAFSLYVGDEGTGTLTISDDGTVSVNEALYLARNTGSTGTLNIGAAATDVAAAAGILDAETLTFGAGAGTLVFNHTDSDYDFATAISGAGTIDHLAGDTIFSADSSGFTGDTTISDGTVLVDGTLGGSVAVNGGTLGGSGTLDGSVSVTDGTIAAGNSPGTLTIAGDLSLSSGSILEFELGSPTGTAGVDSDLIVVGGDLTLDGTLNVTDAGGFGAGLYRLIDYGGTLTDNGLDIGTAPSGYDSTNLTVQTATVGQVNLLVDAALTYFWDGSNTSANNVVDGGTGTWDVSTTNWTTSDGSVNDVYNSSQLLIFAGAAGVVTVDGSAGDVVLQNGMQFAIDGYSVVGDAIGIDGANTIRVGDGTTAGAAYSATIASSLTGSGSLTKTDYGTLVLTGDSSGFTGDTDVDGGTLYITGQLVSTEAA